MRSAAQLAIHCWLDEELRLGVVRVDGVISNIENPLGGHEVLGGGSGSLLYADVRNGSVPHSLPLPSPPSSLPESMTCVATDTSRSSAVTRLSAAILRSRFIDNICLGSVPLHVRTAVLEKDIRYHTLPNFIPLTLTYRAFCFAAIESFGLTCDVSYRRWRCIIMLCFTHDII